MGGNETFDRVGISAGAEYLRGREKVIEVEAKKEELNRIDLLLVQQTQEDESNQCREKQPCLSDHASPVTRAGASMGAGE